MCARMVTAGLLEVLESTLSAYYITLCRIPSYQIKESWFCGRKNYYEAAKCRLHMQVLMPVSSGCSEPTVSIFRKLGIVDSISRILGYVDR